MEIPEHRFHKYRKEPVRFIAKHYQRSEEFREAKKRTSITPPDDWIPPSGLCECGCGGKTLIAKITRRDRGQYQGHPLRSIHGHRIKAMRGPDHPAWKGGRNKTTKGYWIIWRPDHPAAWHNGFIPEHRVVWEDANGRLLESHEVIHHINGDKGDNRPENLEVLTVDEHNQMHRNSPEHRRYMSRAMKRHHKDPEFRKRVEKGRARVLANPEHHERLSRAVKEAWARRKAASA